MPPQAKVEEAPGQAPEPAADPSDFLEFEGTTIFSAAPAPTFRYLLTLKNGQLRIWLEDCESKEQWCSTELGLDDYVNLSNSIIPEASASDYVECFNELLADARDDAGNISSTFNRLQEDVVRLEMIVKTQVLKRSREAKFSFTLGPISVERIDVLESKMKDLQEEVKALRNGKASADNALVVKLQEEMDKLHIELSARDKLISQLQTEMKTVREENMTDVIRSHATSVSGSLIFWEKNGSRYINNGVLRGFKRGTYLVTVVVNYFGGNIRLMKGGQCVQETFSVYSANSALSSTLSCMMQLAENDVVTVVCNQPITKTSYLSLVRLSN